MNTIDELKHIRNEVHYRHITTRHDAGAHRSRRNDTRHDRRTSRMDCRRGEDR